MRLFLVLLSFMHSALTYAQELRRLSLQEAVEMAQQQSIAARQAATAKETRYWEYRTFRAGFKPQLLLESRLPAFSRSFQEVVQPDGTVQFQPVRNNNSALGLSLEQQIPGTGATVYATSQLQRFDDFNRSSTLYNGTLFAVGISQPLFRFNAMKWAKRIEPLKYEESRLAFIESRETIAATATNLFFQRLLAQVNQNIAETNLKNTVEILRIANEKFELGKNSRNEILQLQLEQLKALKAQASAKRDVEISTLNLKTYIGWQGNVRFELLEPIPVQIPVVSAETALKEAFANRPDAVAFGRRLLEAEREVARAKAERGLNAALTASIGFSNRAPDLDELYIRPQDQELVSIEFTVPVLDWGRAEARLKTAEANRQLTQYSIEQDNQNFRQEIFTQITLFEMLKDQVTLTAKADSIAAEKYQIAQERYVLGDLGITDLSIAFAEKDQARRDFIDILHDYWTTFYQLRRLTLYDFEKLEKIH